MTSLVSTLAGGASLLLRPCDASRTTLLDLKTITDIVALFGRVGNESSGPALTSLTRIQDPWPSLVDSRTTLAGSLTTPLLISRLGWSAEEAAEIRLRLLPFDEDWNAPGMEVYDAL